MFKQKMEKIDFSYLTWHNLFRLYEKYQSSERESFEMSRSTMSSMSSDRDSFASV